ncbi:MAG TPA: hypothetical protein VF897_05525 [Roseiflexaceae bacterium]
MATLSRTYTDDAARDEATEARERSGGPRPSRPASRRDAWYERFTSGPALGSHMPLDVEIHWNWRNPLNIIPAFVLLLAIIALVALIVG